MAVKLLTGYNLEFFSLTGDCTFSSESTLVKIPHCWKSLITAQIYREEVRLTGHMNNFTQDHTCGQFSNHSFKDLLFSLASHCGTGCLSLYIEANFLYLKAEREIIWDSPRENLTLVVCEQQRRRPACASAQSDQRLCYSLFWKVSYPNCYKRNFNFLASLCSWAGLCESHSVGNTEDRFCSDEAQILWNSWWENLSCGLASGVTLKPIRPATVTSLKIEVWR